MSRVKEVVAYMLDGTLYPDQESALRDEARSQVNDWLSDLFRFDSPTSSEIVDSLKENPEAWAALQYLMSEPMPRPSYDSDIPF